jgi:hypothetical protein
VYSSNLKEYEQNILDKKILVAAVLPLKMVDTNVVSVNSVGSN